MLNYFTFIRAFQFNLKENTSREFSASHCMCMLVLALLVRLLKLSVEKSVEPDVSFPENSLFMKFMFP